MRAPDSSECASRSHRCSIGERVESQEGVDLGCAEAGSEIRDGVCSRL